MILGRPPLLVHVPIDAHPTSMPPADPAIGDDVIRAGPHGPGHLDDVIDVPLDARAENDDPADVGLDDQRFEGVDVVLKLNLGNAPVMSAEGKFSDCRDVEIVAHGIPEPAGYFLPGQMVRPKNLDRFCDPLADDLLGHLWVGRGNSNPNIHARRDNENCTDGDDRSANQSGHPVRPCRR